MILPGMDEKKIGEGVRLPALFVDSAAHRQHAALAITNVSWRHGETGCALVVIARAGDGAAGNRSWGTLTIFHSGQIDRFDAPVTVTDQPRVIAGSRQMLCFVFRLPAEAPKWPVERMLLRWQGHEIVLPHPASSGAERERPAGPSPLVKGDLWRIERELAAVQRELVELIRDLQGHDDQLSSAAASSTPADPRLAEPSDSHGRLRAKFEQALSGCAKALRIRAGAPAARRRLSWRIAPGNSPVDAAPLAPRADAPDALADAVGPDAAPAQRMLVDIHAHLLPGIDDGPPDLRGAIEMARAAARAGIGTVALTPHLRFDFPDVHLGELGDRCRHLQRELSLAEVPLTLLPAAEVSLIWALEADDEQLAMASYNQRGRDILIETPPDGLLVEQLLEPLLARGMRVTLAHPERSRCFQLEPERLRALQHRGLLLQVNASSLLRRRSDAIRRCAEYLCREDLGHVIASDGHRAASWRPIGNLADAVSAATRLVGASRARWMTSVAPAAILAGTPLPPPPAIELPSASEPVGPTSLSRPRGHWW